MSKCGLVIVAATLLGLATIARAQQSGGGSQPMAQDKTTQSSKAHFDEVNRQGDMAMGFSHLKTTHHFRLTSWGGSVEVQANDPSDTSSRDQIRTHLQHISKAFKNGDFSAPQMTHGRVPPGVPTMQRLKSDINYKYEEKKAGGIVLISTANPEALKAVHKFLRFQIDDHQTGDPKTVQK
jgi:hypothetical protein